MQLQPWLAVFSRKAVWISILLLSTTMALALGSPDGETLSQEKAVEQTFLTGPNRTILTQRILTPNWTILIMKSPKVKNVLLVTFCEMRKRSMTRQPLWCITS